MGWRVLCVLLCALAACVNLLIARGGAGGQEDA
jgi:hypothetical protein